ncbi:hypothetical protein DXA36_02850 [Eisenbergiella sp. OF01-20]|nr:hypothetical protein DXA36_02850 [Eisenbergiella sp. OF01-20]
MTPAGFAVYSGGQRAKQASLCICLTPFPAGGGSSTTNLCSTDIRSMKRRNRLQKKAEKATQNIYKNNTKIKLIFC